MQRSVSMGRSRRRRGRKLCVGGAAIALSLCTLAGCPDKFDEFRAAAAPQLESGLNTLLTGLVSGVFASVDPGNTTTSGDTGGTDTGGTTP